MLMMSNMACADGAKVICNYVERMCPYMVAQYPIRYASVFAKAHHYLDEWNRDCLLASGNLIAFAVLGHRVVAGLSCTPHASNVGLHLAVKGFISTGEASHIGAPMIATAMRYAMATSSLPISSEAIVREIDGVPNVGSARAFTKNGFNTVLRKRGHLELATSHLMLTEPVQMGSIAIHKLLARGCDLKEHGDWEELPI